MRKEAFKEEIKRTEEDKAKPFKEEKGESTIEEEKVKPSEKDEIK